MMRCRQQQNSYNKILCSLLQKSTPRCHQGSLVRPHPQAYRCPCSLSPSQHLWSGDGGGRHRFQKSGSCDDQKHYPGNGSGTWEGSGVETGTLPGTGILLYGFQSRTPCREGVGRAGSGRECDRCWSWMTPSSPLPCACSRPSSGDLDGRSSDERRRRRSFCEGPRCG